MKKEKHSLLKPIILFVLFLAVSAIIFYLPFKIVRDSTIKALNDQQLVMAKQAALGVRGFFDHHAKILTHLSQLTSIIQFDDYGKEQLEGLYHLGQDEIAAITRVDATGHILYTVPYDEKTIGKDISSQEHNYFIAEHHHPVVSDVFTAVQGFQTVALAVPVFDRAEYAGSISILIPFEIISKKYLENIVIGEDGYAWMISQKGVELYCPVPGHIGKTVFETSSQFPSVINMAVKMVEGGQGVTTYEYDRIKDEKTETILKHAVYYPVQLPGNFWSIVVATPEKQALQAVSHFGKWWFTLFVVLVTGILTSVTSWIRFQIISKEKQKLLKVEKKLQDRDRLFSRFIDNAHVPIVMVNVDGTIEFLNNRFQELYGYTLQDIPTMDQWFKKAYPDEKMQKEIRVAWQEKLQKALSTGGAVTFNERQVVCKDGSTKDVVFAYTVIDDRILITLNDNTEHNKLMRAEQELAAKQSRAKKMEVIGLMAGGVAHDLNNILSGVISYPELLLLQLPEDNPMRETIMAIQKSGQRAAAVVADLLTVARGVAGAREVENINEIIEQYMESPECKKIKSLHDHITYETILDSGLMNISCSKVHIEKCLMNLMLNASEAIADRGHILISTRNQYVSSSDVKGYPGASGEYVVLSVKDTGPGIPQEDLGHIFEPFYTKKKMGISGTGLGLAVVWNTVEDHGGTITVESTKEGALFELYFPVSRGVLSTEEMGKGLLELKGNGEHILVVDDEAQQRDIALQILSKLGYIVDCVRSGEEAVEYLKTGSANLVLLDMLMGSGMNGRETYEQIIKIHPDQKAVISSGFSQNDEVRKAHELGAKGFLKKPYTLEQLASAVMKEMRR